jgi:hypothetical protein
LLRFNSADPTKVNPQNDGEAKSIKTLEFPHQLHHPPDGNTAKTCQAPVRPNFINPKDIHVAD